MTEINLGKTGEALASGKKRLEDAAAKLIGAAEATDSGISAESRFFLGQVLTAKKACHLMAVRIRSGKTVSAEAIQACMALTAEMPRLFLATAE